MIPNIAVSENTLRNPLSGFLIPNQPVIKTKQFTPPQRNY